VIVRNKVIVRSNKANAAGRLHKDHAAKAEGREIAKAGGRRMLAAKVAEANGAIAETTGVAASVAASKARPKSISRN
jgi:hypothetical protein